MKWHQKLFMWTIGAKMVPKSHQDALFLAIETICVCLCVPETESNETKIT
jgi:hypothetical protein